MVIKDFRCEICGDTKQDVVVDSCDMSELSMSCIPCEAYTKHVALCTGGTKKRWRYWDWNEDAVRDGVQYLGVKGTQDDKPLVDENGKAYHDQERFSKEAIAEKREIRRSSSKRARGRNNLFFDAATSPQK